ncbi:MAG: hypothetical protein ACD_20C00398G0011 [uncultured bacterium]|nr:MAG: hypothetical protein ACD_20C00398G0011 [uncultured bacterium]
MKFSKEIQEKLLSPFDETEVKFKPTVVKDGKALALAYVDARNILDRLDEVIGIENWQDEYEVISPKQVVCKLTINGITKSDAGEAMDEKEPLKSAVSDALKRAAVKFGIGRYLYRLPKTWCKYDNTRSEFLEIPDLKSKSISVSKQTTPKNSKKSESVDIKKDEEDVQIPECASCKEKITNRVAIFSKKYYQKPLCMKCQSAIMQEKEASAN